MTNQFIMLIVGFFALVGGAEFLIRGSTRIAKYFGISTLIIGLTIVAFGTSAPELFVSVNASYHGSSDVAVGNIIGSNIFNVLIIIGLSALISPVTVPRAVLVRDMPIMLLSLGLFWGFSVGGEITRFEGGILVLGIIAFLYLNYWLVRQGATITTIDLDDEELVGDGSEEPTSEDSELRLAKNISFVVLGLVCMVLGSEWVVTNATLIAKYYSVPDLVIAITIVAIGTSLPELATTVVAAKHGESELAIGNGLGSNIFNVLCVIGIVALIAPLQVDASVVKTDMLFMFASCFLVWPLMYTSSKIGRIEGAIMILAYVSYVTYLVAF